MADERINEAGTKVESLRRESSNVKRVLTLIGTYLVKTTQSAFRLQARGPNSWEPRRIPNVPGILSDLDKGTSIPGRRFEDRPALMDTGQLSKSFAFRFRDAKTIIYGTAIPYANLQQYGGEHAVKMTAAMRRNLSTIMRKNRKQAKSRDKQGDGAIANKVKKWMESHKDASKSEKTEMRRQITEKWDKASAKIDAVSSLGWLFSYRPGVKLTFRVKARPMVGVYPEDRKEMDKIIKREFGR